jgi:low affinity Fe/Cu permease
MAKKNWFETLAAKSAKASGSSTAFILICAATLIWLASGPLFHWSDTWQLAINTFTNIVSMVMVFVIQNSQNLDTSAIQLKLDELLRAGREAKNTLINLEDLTEEDLRRIKERYADLGEAARSKGDEPLSAPS